MIPQHKVFVPPDLDKVMAELRAVIESGWVGEGPQVLKFEKELQPVMGSVNVTALNSGTSSLQMALRLARVGPGDEVVSTPMTCMATNIAIALAGATPVWADVDPTTGNLSPESIKAKITPRTKAIMIVHWGGYPCDLGEIGEIARGAGLKVIEDAAHALGAEYRGKPIGSWSDYACFSFQAIKHIHTGDGGAVVCKSADDHARARSLKWFGIDREHRHINEFGIAEWEIVEPGYKFHMNDLAATLGLCQLPYLGEILAARRKNAAAFREAFQGLKRVRLMSERTDRRSSYWLFPVLVDDRAGFVHFLSERGIAASITHSRNDKTKVLPRSSEGELPGVDAYAGAMVCIPVGQWVDDAARAKIIEAVREEGW